MMLIIPGNLVYFTWIYFVCDKAQNILPDNIEEFAFILLYLKMFPFNYSE